MRALLQHRRTDFTGKQAEKVRPEERRWPNIEVMDREENVLVLYNDNVNTFDYVILCLIEICDHQEDQARQCAFIAHHKGRCEILTGSREYLEPRNTTLLARGLSVEIY